VFIYRDDDDDDDGDANDIRRGGSVERPLPSPLRITFRQAGRENASQLGDDIENLESR